MPVYNLGQTGPDWELAGKGAQQLFQGIAALADIKNTKQRLAQEELSRALQFHNYDDILKTEEGPGLVARALGYNEKLAKEMFGKDPNIARILSTYGIPGIPKGITERTPATPSRPAIPGMPAETLQGIPEPKQNLLQRILGWAQGAVSPTTLTTPMLPATPGIPATPGTPATYQFTPGVSKKEIFESTVGNLPATLAPGQLAPGTQQVFAGRTPEQIPTTAMKEVFETPTAEKRYTKIDPETMKFLGQQGLDVSAMEGKTVPTATIDTLLKNISTTRMWKDRFAFIDDEKAQNSYKTARVRALAEMGMTELTFSLLEPSQAAKFNDVITMRAWDIMLADPATSKSTINKINRMIKERQGITEKPDIGKALEGKPTPTAPQTVAPGTTPKPAGKEPAGKEKISKDMYNQLIAEGYTDEAIRAVYDVEP